MSKRLMETIIGPRRKIEWIDNLKGLAIIAVVIGHMATPLSKFIYSWHIPLFFYISGILIQKERNLGESWKRDFKKLILPYFLFSLLGLAAEYLKRWLFPGAVFVNGSANLKEELVGIFWYMDYSHLHQYGFVLWFLPALFWAKNVYLWLIQKFNNQYVVSVLCFLLLIISNNIGILPFGIDKAMIGLFFLSLPRLFNGKYWYLTLAIWLFVPVATMNTSVKIINLYGIVYSIIAINSVVGIFKKISIKLSLWGRNTMKILVLHPYLNNAAYVLVSVLNLNWLWEIMIVLVIITSGLLIYERYKKV